MDYERMWNDLKRCIEAHKRLLWALDVERLNEVINAEEFAGFLINEMNQQEREAKECDPKKS